jgi:hypothetical protein
MRFKLLCFPFFVLAFVAIHRFGFAAPAVRGTPAKGNKENKEDLVKNHPVTQCLALEEQKIHQKKQTGPHYFLNQQIFNHWVSIAHLKIRPEFVREICHHPYFSPSLALTYMVLRYQQELFSYSSEAVEKAQQLALTKEMVEKIAEVWPQYLATLQSTLPYPKKNNKIWKETWPCLEELVPEIKTYLDKFLYLEEELGTQKLLSDKKDFQKIFEKLKSLDTLNQRCKKVLQTP